MFSYSLAMLEDAGDRRLFDQIYRQYYGKMMGTALAVTSSRPQAEDAVHDAFLKLIAHFEDFRAIPEERRGSWLMTVTRNSAVDILRKEGREVPVEEVFGVREAAAPEDGGFLRLVEMIRAMPEAYRRPLELRFVSEWSMAEIAAALDISVGTAKTRIHRGRRLLMDQMRKEGYR